MSDTAFRTSVSVPTLLGVINQFHGIMNLSYTFRPETTINRKRGVLPGYQPQLFPSANTSVSAFVVSPTSLHRTTLLSRTIRPLRTRTCMNPFRSDAFRNVCLLKKKPNTACALSQPSAISSITSSG